MSKTIGSVWGSIFDEWGEKKSYTTNFSKKKKISKMTLNQETTTTHR